ncbi:hypothetical protein DE146DRAFT_641654 [Phaeosphaeria sp. MPI-PUGE-AT-0046c]|nr:hypothetical protein DE146DRAFT_641654 [Phaeosphaeria sp. MPI-PUGE-AT-0046c]
MAITFKRKRGAVSYREPSSDEDMQVSDGSGQEEHVHSRRVVPSRRSTRHREPSARSASPLPEKRPHTRPRAPRRRERPKVSYKDVSTDDEDDEGDPDAEFEASDDEPPPRAIRPKTSSQFLNSRPHKAQNKANSKGKSPRKRALGAPLKAHDPSKNVQVVTSIPTDGNKPLWSSLPYHVLLQIFVYASHPLRDENMRPMASIAWLVQTAQMCTAFTKPALTALYRNPPVFAIKQKRKDLVYHLISPPEQAREDPRVMVKRLELDVTQMSALTDPSHSITDLVALIKSLSTLRELDIFDPFDRPPFRARIRRIRRWVYPPELFETLRQSEARLRSWRWNSTFCDQGPLWMKSIHSDAAFQSLRELTLTKFHPAEAQDTVQEDDLHLPPTNEELMASALAPLLHLRSLSFETCGIVSGHLLPLLPANLVSLSIINCGELLSDALQAFLATHGAHMEDLTLNHNQSLDLSFLVDLKRSCPRLEILRMDTTYYSSLAMSSDNEPLYETLLGESERPTWPSTLRVIDMEYLRNWNSTAATNFFSSLIDAADELPWLRELTIIAMVDTDWRQRAEYRRKWTDLFQKVFARKWTPPSAHLASFKAFREWKVGHGEPKTEFDKNDSLIEGVPEVAEMKLDDSDSDAPLIPPRRHGQDEKWGSTRLRSRSKAAASYDEASGDDAKSQKEDSSEEEVAFVQGRCHTVLFRIDNFRPREEIFGEADFLDTEPSGDDEWTGMDNDEQNDDGGGYAW